MGVGAFAGTLDACKTDCNAGGARIATQISSRKICSPHIACIYRFSSVRGPTGKVFQAAADWSLPSMSSNQDKVQNQQ